MNQEITISESYKVTIIIGLCLSLVGDIFLMIKKRDLFIYGLLFFLFAHLIYLYAVINVIGLQINIQFLIPSLIGIIIINKTLLPKTGNKKPYVLIYAIVLFILLWQSLEGVKISADISSKLFATGVIMFVISDTLLAYKRFVVNIRFSQLYILSSYYAAQLLIALSI